MMPVMGLSSCVVPSWTTPSGMGLAEHVVDPDSNSIDLWS